MSVRRDNRRCCILQCGCSRSEQIHLFRFPKTDGSLPQKALFRVLKWIDAVKGLADLENGIKSKFICSRHFVPGKPAALIDERNVDWIPTLFQEEQQDCNVPAKKRRCSNELQQFSTTFALEEEFERNPFDIITDDDTFPMQLLSSDIPDGCVSTQCENERENYKQQIQAYKQDIEIYQKQIAELKDSEQNLQDTVKFLQIKCDRGMEFVCENDDKCNYFTGIPNVKTLRELFEYVKNSLDHPFCQNFTKEHMFVMTLTKMRLSSQFTTLAYEYGVSPNTISKYFYRTLYILNDCLRFVLRPSPKDVAIRHTPKNFTDVFGYKRMFILDCFEVQCHTPGMPKAANCHFSGYKRTHTVKFAIVGQPDGTIIFISRGYGGRCSDRFITKDCGLLDMLEAGDVVLADKGFDISDLVREKGATLNIPSFLKSRTQLSPQEMETNKQITSLRVHIERQIRLVRGKYKEAGDFISIDTMQRFENGSNTLDLILRVACILCNFNRSIITG